MAAPGASFDVDQGGESLSVTSSNQGAATIEQTFLHCAKALGVEARIALLIEDCDRALEAYPEDRDRRWYWRIEDQRRRLLDPDFRLHVAVTTLIAEDHPALARLVAVALGRIDIQDSQDWKCLIHRAPFAERSPFDVGQTL